MTEPRGVQSRVNCGEPAKEYTHRVAQQARLVEKQALQIKRLKARRKYLDGLKAALAVCQALIDEDTPYDEHIHAYGHVEKRLEALIAQEEARDAQEP